MDNYTLRVFHKKMDASSSYLKKTVANYSLLKDDKLIEMKSCFCCILGVPIDEMNDEKVCNSVMVLIVFLNVIMFFYFIF